LFWEAERLSGLSVGLFNMRQTFLEVTSNTIEA